ncbi:hypothetical protein SAMN05518865_12617 [Duganella sp. CF458]|uniref:hypothetical protein n=1 Tax=Duganella sp. CF458 TaxID=1884368 RepID=UPI0008EE6A4E|nr:hypothetical protein [Duganella sp. CF458]SFG97301.1 hypothetical protein SAMN05518865_12617 [Duganella sp. CF458]
MSQSYKARFTPCGYSIKQLRSDADRLKKTEGIKHQDALNRIAKSAKYSDWEELIGQESNHKRDNFFHSMYNDRKDSAMVRSNYADYLRRQKLADNKDAYRLFVLQNWKYFVKLGMTDLDLNNEPMSPDAMHEELLANVERRGAAGLLPQNMGARLLETTIWASHIFKGELEVSDEIQQGYLGAALISVAGIRAYQLKSDKVTLSQDELLALIQQYYMLAELEFTSRRTDMTIVLPGLDHIFKPEAELSFQMPESFVEMEKAD